MERFSFDEAVEIALRTWYPKDHELHFEPHHPLGKLLGEWGELLDDYMKSLYKPGYIFEPENELGDIWYYVRILAYQKDIVNLFDNSKLKLDKLKKVDEPLEYLMGLVINEGGVALAANIKKIDRIIQFVTVSFNFILVICYRYNLTLDDLTCSNWQKLKPGSEHGEEWMKAR